MRSTLFIEHNGIFYVPTPTSANAGHSRYLWIKQRTGKESCIARPDTWEKLCKSSAVKIMIETEGGLEIRTIDDD